MYKENRARSASLRMSMCSSRPMDLSPSIKLQEVNLNLCEKIRPDAKRKVQTEQSAMIELRPTTPLKLSNEAGNENVPPDWADFFNTVWSFLLKTAIF